MKISTLATILLLTNSSCLNTIQDSSLCIDESRIKPDQMCTAQYDPVCGCNGKTYGNACEANRAGVTSYTKGACANN